MKKMLAAFCLLFFGGLYLFGCGKSPEELDRRQAFNSPQYHWGGVSGKTLIVWGDATDLERPYFKKSFARYEELTGNKLQIRRLSKREMECWVSLSTPFKEEGAPDIFLSYGGTALDRFKPEENFYDFTNAPWVDDLLRRSINQAVYHGKIIGLPFSEVAISGTLYNKEIFKSYGLKVPRTQQEFMKVCETLRQNDIVPIYLPFKEITMLLYQFPMDSFLQDGRILKALNEGSLSYSDIPQMHKIVAWYRTMSDKGYFGGDYTKNDWAGMSEAMSSGKYAMMLCWDTWLYTDFTGDPTRFGLMPSFMGVPEEGCFEGPNMQLFLVNKNSSELGAALDFITFMADPYNYNVAFAGIYTAPVFKNQIGSMATPQYMESEHWIEKRICDSIAWPRVQGFAQIDASYIQTHMLNRGYKAEDCLRDMDAARLERKMR